jgi:DnaD/phage-associated family protein
MEALMAYQFGNGIWSHIFAVPSEVVDRHIRLCGPLSIKVLLVLLRHDGAVELEELAAILGQSRADVQDALHYWIHNGILHPAQTTAATELSPENVALTPIPAQGPVSLTYTIVENPAEPAPPSPERGRVMTLSNARTRLTTQVINEMAGQDPTIGTLLQETQQIMGRPLSPVLTDLVVALYSYYGMKPDMVLMLIQYCVSLGKDSVRYMEKKAVGWLEQGIDSHEKAEAEILRASQKDQIENKIKTAFGIYDRTLITSEKKYIRTWVEEYGMELPLIQLAYERSIEMKGKLSFAYINGILGNWYQKHITTPAEAMGEINRPKEQRGERGSAPAKASYDMDALEEMISHGDL